MDRTKGPFTLSESEKYQRNVRKDQSARNKYQKNFSLSFSLSVNGL